MLHPIDSPQIAAARKAELFSHEQIWQKT